VINEPRIPSELGARDGQGALVNWFLAELDGQFDNRPPGRKEPWGIECMFS
jgi:hypothetical protein